MRLAALYTGGKDSTYAIYQAKKQGHEVVKLLTIIPESSESYMFHYPNLRFTKLQAEAMGLEQAVGYTRGVKEEELQDLKLLVQSVSHEVDGLLAGAIASSYQKSRVERIASELGLAVVTPLWGREPLELLNEMLNNGFEIVVTAVSAAGLDEKWLGRQLDSQALKELEKLSTKYGVNPCGEGGEIETFVTNCPLFNKRITITKTKKIWKGDNGILIIEEATLT